MRRVVVSGAVVMGVVVAAGIALAPSAIAACHAFDVSVQPASPGEGKTAQVVVSRDGAVNPSSVRVRTVDQTAKAGADYQAVDQRIAFTGDDLQQTLSLKTLQDGADEPTETLRITLSEGAGCPINTNFSYGSATVSIRDDDAPVATTTPTTAAPTTQAPVTTGATSSTTEPATSSSTSSTSPTTSSSLADTTTTVTLAGEEVAAEEDDDDSTGAMGIAALVLALAVAAGVGYVLVRRRTMT